MTLKYTFMRRRIAYVRKELQFIFLKKCRDLNIIPTTLKIKSKKNGDFGTNKIIRKAEGQILRHEIKKTRLGLINLANECYYMFLKLSSILKPDYLDLVMRKLNCIIENENGNIESKHQRKIEHLLLEQKGYIKENKSYEDGVVNLTMKPIDPATYNILKKGPKFCIEKPINNEQLIVDLETAIQNINGYDKAAIKGHMSFLGKKAILTQKNSEKSKTDINILKNFKNDKNVNVLIADKAAKYVVIGNEDYRIKIDKLINELDANELKKDPNNNLKLKLSNIKKNFPEQAKNFKEIPIYCCTPLLFTKIKLHKQDKPIRPIVNRNSSPVVALEKYVNSLLKPLIKGQHSIKNSLELLEQLRSYKLTKTDKFYSIDVISLYPSIPINEIIDIIIDLCKTQNSLKNQIEFLKSALNLINESNVFQVNNKIYKQTKGSPMGSCLSATLGEITLEYIEEYVYNNSKLKPTFYKRYVDDAIVIWPYTENELHRLIDNFNSVFHSINFTIEKENERTIPFLDIKIHRTENLEIWTETYYKPSSPLAFQTYDSYTPLNYLRNSITPIVKRTYTHNTYKITEDKELKIIRRQMYLAGYPKKYIRKWTQPCNENITKKREVRKKKHKYIGSIEYNRNLYPIVKFFNEMDMHLAFRNNKAKNYIVKDRDKKLINGGVYKIPIKNEEKEICYIGRTRRELDTRIKEHKRSLNSNYNRTTLTDFLFDNKNAIPEWNKAEILFKPNTDKQLDIYEKLYIGKFGENCVNLAGSITGMNIWQPLMQIQKK